MRKGKKSASEEFSEAVELGSFIVTHTNEHSIGRDENGDTSARKILSFSLNERMFDIDAENVCVILNMREIFEISKESSIVKGIIRVAGNVIPLLDLPAKLGMDCYKAPEEACIVVVSYREVKMGFIVDRFPNLDHVQLSEVSAPNGELKQINPQYVRGIREVAGEARILLDISKVISRKDTEAMYYAIMEGQIVRRIERYYVRA